MPSPLPWWPAAGPIALSVHDLPHAAADTEWWYVNTHVRTADGRELGLFAAFFRIISAVDEATKQIEYAHSMTWALSDLSTGTYIGESRVDERSPQLGLERIKNQRGVKDERLNRAMQEILERDQVPAPDRVFDGAVNVAFDKLALQYGASGFVKQADGSYRVTLVDHDGKHGAELVFAPQEPPVRHGDDGVVRGNAGEQMFYYFIPRCAVTGSVMVDGERAEIAQGSGWYDHEFGGYVEQDTPKGHDIAGTQGEGAGIRDLGWNWTAVQLDDGTDLTAYEIVDVKTNETVGKWLIAIDKAGTRRSITDVTFEAKQPWTSTRTLDEFFSAVGTEVRKSTAAVLPYEPTHEEMRDLIASEELAHYMDGVSSPGMVETLIKPIREMVDRGGKSLRSYAALACCAVVGGDSRKFRQWLAMPELMHVGSLIIDDVQDQSTVRRGGPTCHVVHGEPIAINAGTAAYFLTQNLLHSDELNDKQKLRIYDLYFSAMRAGR